MRAMRSGTFEYRISHQAPPAEWQTTDASRRSLPVNTCHRACRRSGAFGRRVQADDQQHA